MGLRVALVAALVGAAACSDGGTEPPPAGEPGLSFASISIADTVEADGRAIEVELRDADGRPDEGASVALRVEEVTAGARVLFSGAGDRWDSTSTVVTDAEGRASRRIRFGTVAGEGRIIASAGGRADTLPFHVKVGAPVAWIVHPADTAVAVGASYPFRYGRQDRLGNLLATGVSMTTMDTAAAMDGEGTVTGVAVGRAGLDVTVTTLTTTGQDTAYTRRRGVSVVPDADMVAYWPPKYDQATVLRHGRLVRVHLDGSAATVLFEDGTGGWTFDRWGPRPAASPDGSTVAFVVDGALLTVPAAGGAPTVVVEDTMIEAEVGPRYGPDGAWIYYTRGQTFWRVRTDGSDAGQVSPVQNWGVEVAPSPDPAGTEVVYMTNVAGTGTSFTLRTLDLATGAVDSLDVPGMFPVWSPDGEWIAFLRGLDTGGIYLHRMRPDGTDVQMIGENVPAHSWFDWSPDSEFLLVSHSRSNVPSDRGPSLVHVESGDVLPISMDWDRTVIDPGWLRH